MLALAWRNLWRHPRRTWLNLSAMAFAAVVTIFMLALQVGTYNELVDRALKVVHGYAQVRPAEDGDSPTPRGLIRDAAAVAARVGQAPGVAHASPRALGYALLSSAERSYAVQVIGVDPVAEPQVSTLPGSIRAGRFLSGNEADEIVLGAVLAKNLKVQPGDTVTLLGMARDGSVAADSLRVAGVFETGTRELDRGLAQMPLGRFQGAFAMPGAAHAIVVTTASLAELDGALAALRERLAGQGLAVLGWDRLAPGLKQAIELDAGTAMALYAGLLVVVVFSLLNSLLISVLERTREFGVLLGIGMAAGKLGRLVWLETVLLASLGVGLGLLLGGAATAYYARYGLRLEGVDAIVAQWGLPDRLYPVATPFTLLTGPAALFASVVLAGIMPVLRIRRLKALEAMRSA